TQQAETLASEAAQLNAQRQQLERERADIEQHGQQLRQAQDQLAADRQALAEERAEIENHRAELEEQAARFDHVQESSGDAHEDAVSQSAAEPECNVTARWQAPEEDAEQAEQRFANEPVLDSAGGSSAGTGGNVADDGSQPPDSESVDSAL